jgi:hypothetical protein
MIKMKKIVTICHSFELDIVARNNDEAKKMCRQLVFKDSDIKNLFEDRISNINKISSKIAVRQTGKMEVLDTKKRKPNKAKVNNDL